MLHLSDLHLDGRPGYGERLRSVVAAIEADLCVLTGDYALKYRPKPEGLAEELGAIVSAIRAPRGVFGVLGNHDDSSLLDLLRDRGVDMLVNEHRRVSVGDAALWVVGVDDPCSYHTDDLASALAGVPREEFTVLLAHSPDLVDEAAEAGVDLYLCGHTHGGQIVLPGVGALYPRGPVRRYMRGLWHRGDMAGYTNRGLGCVYLEARWGAPPEAAVLTLRREEKEDER